MPEYYNPYHPTSIDAMRLTQAQMQTNAQFIYRYLSSKYGWTRNAVAGLLGNAEAESTINPARPQDNAVRNHWYPSCPGYTGDAPTPTTTWYGFGLFQVTPYMALSGKRENPYNYGNWARAKGLTFLHTTGGTGGQMEPQLDWIASDAPSTTYHNSAEPSRNQAKWYQHGSSPINAPTTKIYAKLTASPEDCAITFYWNLERSSGNTPGNRPKWARKWFDFLAGTTPGPEPPTPPVTPKTKSNFLIVAYASGVIK